MIELFKYLRAPRFLKDFTDLTYTSRTRQKWNGKASREEKAAFTEAEKNHLMEKFEEFVQYMRTNAFKDTDAVKPKKTTKKGR